MKILYIAEIVGRPGSFVLRSMLTGLKAEYQPHLIIVQGDAASGGWGLSTQNAWGIKKLGANLIILADLAYNKKDMQELLDQAPFLIRPLNLPPQGPGKGWRILQMEDQKLGVISLLGQNGFQRLHADNPIRSFEFAREKILKETPNLIVDLHALSTAEKSTFFHYARGKCSAVIGSGTRVPTADGQIQQGTFTLSDVGRTGSFLSCGGMVPGPEIQRFSLGLHEASEESWEGLEIQGLLLEVDEQGKSTHFNCIRIPCKEKPNGDGRDRSIN